jgi:hypothetical protein
MIYMKSIIYKDSINATQRSFQLKFLSKRFRYDFYLIIFLNGINWLKNSNRKTQNMLNYSLPCSCSSNLSSYFDKRSHLNLLLWNRWTKLNRTWQGWSLGGSLSKLCPTAPPSIQDGVLHIILKVGHPKIISTQISEQKI